MRVPPHVQSSTGRTFRRLRGSPVDSLRTGPGTRSLAWTGMRGEPLKAGGKALTAKRLRELLVYERESGRFSWRTSRGRAPAGSEAGSIDKDGYRRITLDGRDYQASHLVHLLLKGRLPGEGERIEHLDQCRSNNAAANLRLVREGLWRKQFNGDLTGVIYDASRSRYRAVIRANGKVKYLGNFRNPEDAKAAYDSANSALPSDLSSHRRVR